MNTQDIRNLSEAYMEVVENQQLNELDKKTLQSYQSKAKNQVLGSMSKVSDTTVKRVKGLQLAQKRLKDKKYGQQKEQTDLYDIILSHLLDEGYADTQQAAEAIMVNMSEDWRESICEGLGGAKNQGDYDEIERKRKEVRDEHLRKYKSGELPFQKQKKADQAQDFLKKYPKKKK